jgi:ABC-type phosphate transport system substrate-binding protein
MRIRASSILALLALLWAAPAAAAEPAPVALVVVVHPGVQVSALPRPLLSRYFLKKTTQWPDGSLLRPVEPIDPALRRAFAEQVHLRSAADITAYWIALIFSGRELPPLEKASDADLVAWVRATPGAIGYVAAGADTTGVKVVPVVR